MSFLDKKYFIEKVYDIFMIKRVFEIWLTHSYYHLLNYMFNCLIYPFDVWSWRLQYHRDQHQRKKKVMWIKNWLCSLTISDSTITIVQKLSKIKDVTCVIFIFISFSNDKYIFQLNQTHSYVCDLEKIKLKN